MAFTPSDPLYGPNQTDLSVIGMPAAWNVTLGSSSVVAAVLDTGLALAHPDLAGQWSYASGRTPAEHVFVTGASALCPVAVTPEDDGWQDPVTPFTHGTHVAGTIAAQINNGAGVAGIAPGARIQPLKVLDCTGTGSFADIDRAITFAADNRARIINMSLGANLQAGCPSSTQEAIDYAYGRGAFITAAAGNAGTAAVHYPAGCANMVSVGATDNADARAWFSQHPPSQTSGLDVTAPGVDIMSSLPQHNRRLRLRPREWHIDGNAPCGRLRRTHAFSEPGPESSDRRVTSRIDSGRSGLGRLGCFLWRGAN